MMMYHYKILKTVGKFKYYTRYAELIVQMRHATTLVLSLIVGTLRHYTPSQPLLVKRSRRLHIINRRQNGANGRL
jgi:hypothetical protein